MIKMSGLTLMAVTALLTQTLFAADLKDSFSGKDLLLAANGGANMPAIGILQPAKATEADERKATLDGILADVKKLSGASNRAADAELLINYLGSPRAAAALSGARTAGEAEKLAAIDAIWALGELKDGASAPALEKLLASPDRTVRLNVLAALKKTGAASRLNLRGLKEADYSAITPGDFLFRKGVYGMFSGSLSVGHTAIFYGMEDGIPMVIHATAWEDVSKADMDVFINEKPYYGNRTTPVPPTRKQRARILAWLVEQLGLPFDLFHTTQKGPDTFDCVGLTEAAYEAVGINPTPDELEHPLEPHDQYDNTVPN